MRDEFSRLHVPAFQTVVSVLLLAIILIPFISVLVGFTGPVQVTREAASVFDYNPGRFAAFKTPVSDSVRQAVLLAENPPSVPNQELTAQSSVGNISAATTGQHPFTLDSSALPQNEQSVAVSGNTVVVASNDYRNYLTFLNECNYHNNCNGIFLGTSIDVSHDGGLTVAHDQLGPVIASFNGSVQGDPSVAISSTGTIYVASLNFTQFLPFPKGCDNGIAVWKSTDSGNSFAAVTQPVKFIGSPACSVFADKDAIAVDAGHVYVTWTNITQTGSAEIAVAVSTNQGLSWVSRNITTPLRLSNRHPAGSLVQFSYPAVAPDGTVYVTYADYTDAYDNFITCFNATLGSGTCNQGYGPANLMLTKSTNGGLNWSPPINVATLTKPMTWPFLGIADQGFRIATQPKIAIDASTSTTRGNIYISWEDLSSGTQPQLGLCEQTSSDHLANIVCTPGGRGLAVWEVHSSNGGATWSPKVLISGGGHSDSYFPWLAVDSSNGHVVVGFYTSEPDPYNNRIYIGLSTSINGGLNFSEVILPQYYVPGVDFFFRGGFWGDYLGVAAASGNVVIAYTGDGRLVGGYHQQDPYVAIVSD